MTAPAAPGPDHLDELKRKLAGAQRLLDVHGLDGGATLAHAAEHHPALIAAAAQCAAAIMTLITGATSCPHAPSYAEAFTTAAGQHIERAHAAMAEHDHTTFGTHHLASMDTEATA